MSKALEELKAVLAKHKLSISFDCSEYSDTYGIYDGHICIDDKYGNTLCRSGDNDWNFDSSDIDAKIMNDHIVND